MQSAYIRKEERSQFPPLKNKKKRASQTLSKKEIIKIGTEIDEIENRKLEKNVFDQKLIEKINKSDRPLTKTRNKKKKMTQLASSETKGRISQTFRGY